MSEPRSAYARRRAAGRPAAVLALGAAALAVALVPRSAEALQLDRALVAREPWRLLTAHLTHFSMGHLAYDLAVFLLLGLVCESRWPRRTRAGLGAGLLACSAAVLAGAPELDTYRGLSGLGSALFLLLAARLYVERAFRSTWARTLPALAVACFLAKLAYEVRSGSACFVHDAGLFVPVPSAHLAGGMLGLLVGAWPPRPVAAPMVAGLGVQGMIHVACPPPKPSRRSASPSGSASSSDCSANAPARASRASGRSR